MDFVFQGQVPQKSAGMAAYIDSSEGQVKLPLNQVQAGDGISDAGKTVPWERRFEPYDFNGGVCATYSFFFTLFNSNNSLLSTLSCLSF